MWDLVVFSWVSVYQNNYIKYKVVLKSIVYPLRTYPVCSDLLGLAPTAIVPREELQCLIVALNGLCNKWNYYYAFNCYAIDVTTVFS